MLFESLIVKIMDAVSVRSQLAVHGIDYAQGVERDEVRIGYVAVIIVHLMSALVLSLVLLKMLKNLAGRQ